MKEHKINEPFQYQDETLKAVINPNRKEKNPCKGCYFMKTGYCWDDEVVEVIGECEALKRSDSENIIFVEQKYND